MSNKHYIYSVSFFRETGEPFTILCTSFDRCVDCARMVKKEFSQIPNVYVWFSKDTIGGYAISMTKSDLLRKYVIDHIDDVYASENI